MTCTEARDQFSALVDEALSREARAALDAHLAACPECPPELARFRGTVSLLASVKRERAPVGFVDRVMDAAVPVPWYRRLRPWAGLPQAVKRPLEAAAIVLVGVGVVYVFQRTPELREATRLETPAPERYATSSTAAPSVTPREPLGSARGPLRSARGQSSAREDTSSPRERRPTERPSSPAGPGAATEPAPPPAPPPSRAGETETAGRGTPKAPEPEARDSLASRALAPPAAPPPTVPPSPAAPVPGTAGSALRRAAPEAAVPRAEPRGVLKTAALLDVTVRLLVIDRVVAERAVAELAPRHRAAIVGRRADADTTVIELVVPRATYPELVRGLTSLGRLRPESQPESLPEEVRLGLRIVTD